MISKLAAPLLFAACFAAPAMAQSSVAKPVMLIHGNYCGPGNNAPLPPVDALDAACARHDACTPDDALPLKSCNVRLEQEAAQIANDPRQPQDVRSMAGLVSFGASMMLAKTDTEPTVQPVASSVHRKEASRAAQWARLPTAKRRPDMR